TLRTKHVRMFFDGTTPTNSVRDSAYATAPAALRDSVAVLKFKPVFSAGVAVTTIPGLILSADIRQQLGDGISSEPKTQVAGGAEYHVIPFVPLRFGAAYLSDGWGVSGGFGISVGGFELGLAASRRSRDGGKEPGGALTLVSIR